MSPKETEPKKRALPDGANVAARAPTGFSDSPSMVRSENAAHPVRRPSGLRDSVAVRGWVVDQQQRLAASFSPQTKRLGATPLSCLRALLLSLLLLLLLLPHYSRRRARRAPQRKGEKRRPCLSAASLGAVPLCARSAGNRCGSIASASVRRRWFWFLLPRQKGLARAAGESP